MDMKLNSILLGAGPILRQFLMCVLRVAGMGRLVSGLGNAYIMNDDQLEECYRSREQFCSEFSKKWLDSGLDVLITPAFPTVTFLDSLADDIGNMLDYLHLWSITCYPAGTVPITTVDQNEQTYSDKHNDMWTSLLKKNAVSSAGLPVSVQVISHFNEDEKVLAVMKQIDDKVKLRMQVPQGSAVQYL